MKLRWTPKVADELEEIWQYLDRERPELAQSTIRKLYFGVLSLKRFPLRGRPGRREGTRELLYLPMPLLAIYRVHHDVVEILGFRHTSQDYERD